MSRALLALIAAGSAACSSATTTATPPHVTTPPSGSTSPGPTASPTATAGATLSPSARATLEGCPAPVQLASLPPLARLAGGPDDVTVIPDGHLWLTLNTGGGIAELDAGGHTLRTLPDAGAPEGIVQIAGSRLAVAEQTPDRVVAVDLATGARTTVVQLASVAAGQGVDGIGLDGDTLIVPDSAHGTVVERALDGGPIRLVARGLGRPVGVAPAGDGTLLVADETLGALLRVDPRSPDARPAVIARLGTPDDVVVSRGLVYVTDLAAGRLVAVDPATGGVRLLVAGAPQPQGLALLADGRLVLVDSGRQVVVTVSPCG